MPRPFSASPFAHFHDDASLKQSLIGCGRLPPGQRINQHLSTPLSLSRPVCAAFMVYLLIVSSRSIIDRRHVLGGVVMIKHLMERLVLEVVRSVIGDEAENLSSDSDFDVLDVDQLGMTDIVFALESRLGIELPTHLEDARTVADLVTGAQDELRKSAAKLRLSQGDRPLPILNGQAALSRPRPRNLAKGARSARTHQGRTCDHVPTRLPSGCEGIVSKRRDAVLSLGPGSDIA
jgi:acyl carrier protein